jgi:hypothetical protein
MLNKEVDKELLLLCISFVGIAVVCLGVALFNMWKDDKQPSSANEAGLVSVRPPQPTSEPEVSLAPEPIITPTPYPTLTLEPAPETDPGKDKDPGKETNPGEDKDSGKETDPGEETDGYGSGGGGSGAFRP